MKQKPKVENKEKIKIGPFIELFISIISALAATFTLYPIIFPPIINLYAKVEQSPFKLSPQLQKKISTINADKFLKYKIFRKFTVVNDTESSKENTHLFLENGISGEFTIIRKGKITSDEFSEKIPIGSLFPSEEIIILVWSNNSVQNQNDDCIVVYNKGAAKVKKNTTINRIIRWMQHQEWLAMIIACLIVFLAVKWVIHTVIRQGPDQYVITKKKNRK